MSLVQQPKVNAGSKIRVVHIVFSLEPGGMENGLVNVANALDPDEFEIDVCCLTKAGEFRERLPAGSKVVVLNKGDGFSWMTVFQLAKALWKLQPDVIHTHNLGPLIYGSLATMAGRWRPIIHGEHGMTAANQPQTVHRRRFFYGSCRVLHTVSYELRQLLIHSGLSAQKTIVLRNGVDLNRFSPMSSQLARQKAKLPLEGPVLGIVARFDPQKRHLTLLEAFERISKRWPAAQLLVVGDRGEIRDKVLESLRASPASDRIHVVGFTNAPAIYYQAMDLLVAPSVHEGLSNVVLEAMSCGVPVLAHKACGNSEIITHEVDGWVADLEQADNLAIELEKILSAPEHLGRMGAMARKNVGERFSMPAMVQNYARLYRQLAGRAV